MSFNSSFQRRVAKWITECFGVTPESIKKERSYRFLEESLELSQSLGCTKLEALELLEYVYSRPPGDVKQEIGGTMITLAGLCAANGVDMEELGENELERIWQNIDKIREKRKSRVENSPLP